MNSLTAEGLIANPDLALLLPDGQFITWLLRSTAPFKKLHGTRIDSLGADARFTYFARMGGSHPCEFVKVPNAALAGIHITKLDGKRLRDRFMSDVLPQADAMRSGKPFDPNWDTGNFTYSLDPASKSLHLRYDCYVKGAFVKSLDRTYSASYDLASDSFRNGTIAVENRIK